MIRQMMFMPILLAALWAGSAPAQDGGGRDSGLEQALASRDPDLVSAWIGEHPDLVFRDGVELAWKWLDATANGVAPADPQVESIELLLGVLDGEDRLQFLDELRGWDRTTAREVLVLASELEALATGGVQVLPSPRSLARLRERIDALGSAPLHLGPVSRIVPLLREADRQDEARSWVEWVRQESEAHGDPWRLAWSEEWLGKQAWRQGDLSGAARHLERAAEVEQVLGDAVYRTHLLADVANAHLGMSDLAAGMAWANRAEQLARTLDDPAPLRRVLQVRAGILLDLGEHLEALRICLDDTPAEPERLPRDATQVELDLLASGILSDLGRLESALTFAERALLIARMPQVSERAPHVSLHVLLTLGLLLGDLGRHEEGIDLLEQAVRGFREIGDPRGEAWARKNIGWVRLAQGRPEQAVEALDEARATGARLGVPYLEGLCALGVCEAWVAHCRAGGPFDRERFDAMLAIAERRAGEMRDMQIVWRIAAVRGHRLALAGDLNGALEQFSRSVAQIERWRRRLSTPGLLTHSLRSRSDPYVEAAFLAARLGEQDASLRFTELLRARTLFERRGRRDGSSPSGDDERLSALRRQVAQAEFRLREDRGLDSGERAGLEQEVRRLEGELDAALLGVEVSAARSRRGEPVGGGESPRVEQLQQALRPDETLLSYLVGDEQTLVFVLTRHGSEARLLEVGRQQLAEWTGRIRAPMEALRRGELDLMHLGFDVAAARQLDSLLLSPFREQLTENLLIVPDDCLGSLPFELLISGGEALPVDPAEPFAHLGGQRFRVRDHTFRYLSALPARYARAAGRRGGELALLVAPDDVGVAFAAAEVEAIRRATSARGVRLIERAAPDDLAGLPDGIGALHFVAHGIVDREFPSHGHLRLGGGRLEAWQIERTSLEVDLTVLSACHTAEGSWFSGEGLMGLTRSFLVAGSDAVIASQWAVDDQVTVRLMEGLYRHLDAGASAAAALRRARIGILEGRDSRGFRTAHPYFWAAWVVHQ